jgi:hypothetical protein
MSEYSEFICIERQNSQDIVLDHADNVRQGLDLPSQITSWRQGVEGIKLEGQLWIRRIAADMVSYRTMVYLAGVSCTLSLITVALRSLRQTQINNHHHPVS